jgi:hypothetical protein
MILTRNLILQLKAVKEERKLSLGDILNLIEKNNDYLSKTSLSRLFQEGSEEQSFKEETLLPVARALLDINTLEETDNVDERAMKTLLQYKSNRISELEQQIERLELDLSNEKVKRHEALDRERELYNRRVDFLKSQIILKDERIDRLMNALLEKDKDYSDLLKKNLSHREP